MSFSSSVGDERVGHIYCCRSGSHVKSEQQLLGYGEDRDKHKTDNNIMCCVICVGWRITRELGYYQGV